MRIRRAAIVGPGRRRALQAGAFAGPAFIVIYTVEGLRREGYDPLRHPVSSLALGPRGRVQRLNFTIIGLSYLGFGWGLRAEPGDDTEPLLSVLVAAAGVGLLTSAAAQTDPVGGYPPDTPPTVTDPTWHGMIHDVGALPVFLGIPAACLISAARSARHPDLCWAGWSLATGSCALIMLGLSVAAFAQHTTLVRWGGLFQRVAVMSCLGWLTTLATRALHRTPTFLAETIPGPTSSAGSVRWSIPFETKSKRRARARFVRARKRRTWTEA
jgi:hypothetical protein